MCRFATVGQGVRVLALFLATLSAAYAQTTDLALEWRRIGNAAMDLALPSFATGQVSRVWYSDDGNALYAQLKNGQVWETDDFETWKRSGVSIAPTRISAVTSPLPEANAKVVQASTPSRRHYAVGRFVYRSDTFGQNWTNVTAFRGQSILGEGLTDLTISPRDGDEVTVSSHFGVWRSMDGGATWSGLNQGLPNLPAKRILDVPNGVRSARLEIPGNNGNLEVEWMPGERAAWRMADASRAEESQAKAAFSQQLGFAASAFARVGNAVYVGSRDGRIFTSLDNGSAWQPFALRVQNPISALFLNSNDPRLAIATVAASKEGARVLRTVNGGQTWDDISTNLPQTSVNGVTADIASNSIYVATTAGVFQSNTDLMNLTVPANWQRISDGLSASPALDVKLDDSGNQLFVLQEGTGVFAAMAPHRLRQLSVVNSADFSQRPAAPGSLLSILGSRLERVRSGDLNVPVLGASDLETQVQVPFEAKGSTLSLQLESGTSQRSIGVPLAAVSPAIFLDRDGSALLLDADNGVALDAANPAKSGARIQILATGLGAVNPAWPTGVPAPAQNVPSVVAPVTVLLDREPVEVLRATLAPTYVGFYLVEIQLPKLVNAGPAELTIQAGDKTSNRVRLYLVP